MYVYIYRERGLFLAAVFLRGPVLPAARQGLVRLCVRQLSHERTAPPHTRHQESQAQVPFRRLQHSW